MAIQFVDNILSALRSRRAPSPRKTLGVGGAVVYGGYLQQNEDDPRLAGRERYKTFSNIIANVEIVASGIRLFLNLISKVGWSVDAPDEGGASAEERAAIVEDILHDMQTPWFRVVRRAAMFKFYGFSFQEWTAKLRDDGAVGLLDVEARPQITIERWDLDRTGTLHGVVQRSPQDGEQIYLPRRKLVYAVDDAINDTPEGLGLLRHVVDASRRLKRYEQLEGYGFENDLRGVPVGRAPFAELQRMVDAGELTDNERKQLEEPMRRFIQSHIKNPQLGLLLDSVPYQSEDDAATPSSTPQWSLELLKSGATSQGDINVAIERVTRSMARVLSVEHLLLGGDGKGSLALSRDKTQSFALVVDSALKELADTFNHDLIDPLWTLNGWPDDEKPTLRPDPVQFRDIEQVTSALRDMAQAGAVLDPTDEAIDTVRDLLGLPHVPDRMDMAIDASLSGGESSTGDGDDEVPDVAVDGEDEEE